MVYETNGTGSNPVAIQRTVNSIVLNADVVEWQTHQLEVLALLNGREGSSPFVGTTGSKLYRVGIKNNGVASAPLAPGEETPEVARAAIFCPTGS